jgi:hypothetical protein
MAIIYMRDSGYTPRLIHYGILGVLSARRFDVCSPGWPRVGELLNSGPADYVS